MSKKKPLILFIDAYDSFSNNIVSLLETTLDASVRTVKIDNFLLASDKALHDELRYYTAVVCGPGPGQPGHQEDIGIMRRIWELDEQHILPVLGICLGFQSLCTSFGGKVDKLRGPQHGMIRNIAHVGESSEVEGSIFQGVGEIRATLYQSLHADIGHSSMSEDIFLKEKWKISRQCPELIPLAWAEWDGKAENDSGMRDERILLAVRHRIKPFWALQYHPESICTNEESRKVIENWFMAVEEWNTTSRKYDIEPLPHQDSTDKIIGQSVIPKSLLDQNELQPLLNSWKPGLVSEKEKALKEVLSLHLNELYHCQTIKLPEGLSAPDILEILRDTRRDQIILDSSNSHETAAQVKGRYSIIALDVDDGLRFDYVAGRDQLKYQTFKAGYTPSSGGYKNLSLDPQLSGGIWPFLAQFLEKRRISDGNPESPFWGGFMGYTSYEMGLEAIDVKSLKPGSGLDLCLSWVTRSIVLDHEKGLLYIQDVSNEKPDGSVPAWIVATVKKLSSKLPPGVFISWWKGLYETTQRGRSLSESSFPCGEFISQRPPHSSDPRCSNEESPAPLATGPEEMTDEILLADCSRVNQLFANRLEPENGSSSASSLALYQDAISTSSQPSSEPSPRSSMESDSEPPSIQKTSSIKSPSTREYENKVRVCQSYIRGGDSYELCLTDQSTVRRHRFDETWDEKTQRHSDSSPHAFPYVAHNGSGCVDGDAWSLYRKLRTQQPAPFASFIRLGQATLISASPERFLKWTVDGHCELRPMKGTVRKSVTVSTLEQAKALLDVPKEKAENLMIVDLVRHDLHSICGSGNVTVPRLMVVEEYKSVFQMISIVEGRIPLPGITSFNNARSRDMLQRHTGIDVLAASLPPGSMTGAPKKRSCEILQEIEQKPRGLYSGVVGYMDIGGRGDWSVTIRCMFRWDEEDVPEQTEKGGFAETWHVGAGGAVTALSTPEEEQEEMLTKLSGTLGIFR
ncbi:Aminodeoxychorismate synthase [Hyphodiscus hymeniophilus]|uniref:aminodeoxychorismate synthase n=1 Tax=Hyphodiscus hymeniophilus TaxID=353542 RepID=A0A9P6VHT6_9HELO|nr:Aminodeoxychorismate synthase [Hyphodiscus hymeniophilus]